MTGRLGPLLVLDDLGQGPAVDELHRIVVHAPLAPDREDRHDVGVVELGGGVGLGLESPELRGSSAAANGSILARRDAQRDLLGLVDDPIPPRPARERGGNRRARPAPDRCRSSARRHAARRRPNGSGWPSSAAPARAFPADPPVPGSVRRTRTGRPRHPLELHRQLLDQPVQDRIVGEAGFIQIGDRGRITDGHAASPASAAGVPASIPDGLGVTLVPPHGRARGAVGRRSRRGCDGS